MTASGSPPQRPGISQQLTPRRLVLALAILGITLGLALVLRDFVRETIVLPLANFFWVVWLALMSLHQAIWWGLLLLLGLVLALRSLNHPGVRLPRTGAGAGPGYKTSRYAYWHGALQSQVYSPFARERIRRDLQGLVLRLLASQLRTEPEDIRERVQAGEIELPPAVAALFTFTPAALFEPEGRWNWRRWFRRPASRAPGLDVEPVLEWLEEQSGVLEEKTTTEYL